MRKPSDGPGDRQPAKRKVARFGRGLAAAIIVFGSAGVGFWASQIWPLPGYYGPAGSAPQINTATMSNAAENTLAAPLIKASRVGGSPESAGGRSLPVPLKAEAAAVASVPEVASIQPVSAPRDAAVVAPHTADQSERMTESAAQQPPSTSKVEHIKPVARGANKPPHRIARARGRESAPRVAQLPPVNSDYRRDRVLREFMENPQLPH